MPSKGGRGGWRGERMLFPSPEKLPNWRQENLPLSKKRMKERPYREKTKKEPKGIEKE